MRNEKLLTACAVGIPAVAAAAPLMGSLWLYLLFDAVCQQRPERALWIAGAPMAVCARCFGIYAGFALALLFRLPPRPRALAAAIVLIAADVAAEWLALRPAWAAGRFLTGFLLGATTAALLSPPAAALSNIGPLSRPQPS